MKTPTSYYKTIYEGIVIQNDDPAGMGRVKVYIPAIHADLALEEEDYNQNINQMYFGTNVQDSTKLDLTPSLAKIRKKLPQWCRVLQPITGETSGDVKLHSPTGLATDSDNDDFDSRFETSENLDGPHAKFEGETDVFNGFAGEANPDSGAYPYNKRFHQAKGNFGTIAVNTHVWVTFINGSPLEGLVIGASPSADAMQSFLTPDIQPSNFENRDQTST